MGKLINTPEECQNRCNNKKNDNLYQRLAIYSFFFKESYDLSQNLNYKRCKTISRSTQTKKENHKH